MRFLYWTAIAWSVANSLTAFAGTETNASRRICLPDPAVVGRGADEQMCLMEKMPRASALVPDAVEVLMQDGRCIAVVAKYFGDGIGYEAFMARLRERHGRPLDEDLIDTAHWRFRAPDGRGIVAYLHKQGSRVTVGYAEDKDKPSVEGTEKQ